MLSFAKYQGAGNDFILIDNRTLHFDCKLVSKLCHRKFGIGADGVVLLESNFRMRIFNSDGSEAESCGNGLRCLMRFLLDLGFPKADYQIQVGNRVVQAGFVGDKIRIDMGEALHFKQLLIEGHEVHFLNTGVPHTVLFSAEADLATIGPFLRYHEHFQPAGTNVNIAQLGNDGALYIRTYERGVEAETLACGTGAAAVALIASQKYGLKNPIRVHALGGEMEVLVDGLKVSLIGEATKVFEGSFFYKI